MSNRLRKILGNGTQDAKSFSLTDEEVGILKGLNHYRSQAFRSWDEYCSNELAKRLGVHPSRLGKIDFDKRTVAVLPEPVKETAGA